jgi:hypothetical protein
MNECEQLEQKLQSHGFITLETTDGSRFTVRTADLTNLSVRGANLEEQTPALHTITLTGGVKLVVSVSAYTAILERLLADSVAAQMGVSR